MPNSCACIIDKLIEQRRVQGMTQKELADIACLTQSAIARFENKKAMPQLDTLFRIAKALKCKLVIIPECVSP